MNARDKTELLYRHIQDRTGKSLSFHDANTLRRASLTLHRWAELECGDGNGFIERDDVTNKPRYFNTRARYLDPRDPRAFHSIPDRERGALKRVAAVCAEHGLHYYHQTDPRGCALYVSSSPLTDSDYSRGVAI